MDKAQVMAKRDAPSQDKSTFKLRQHCARRRGALKAYREEWMPDWQQVSDYVDPARGEFSSGVPTPRKKRSRAKIINSTATKCVRVAVAGMSSHMTSKSRPWFKLETPDPKMQERFDVRVWLDDVTEILTGILAKSNFYKAMPVVYTEDLMFGVAVMLLMPNDDEVIRFHTLTVGTYAIGLDKDGRVDSLWREYRKSARDLKKLYGEENLPLNVRQALKGQADQKFLVQSLFELNPDSEPGIGPLGVQRADKRPWREVVWMDGSSGEKHGVLDIAGHYEAPFVAIRWNPVGDDVYSNCPCIDTLGDIKQLQYLEGQKLKLIDMIADPALSMPDVMRTLGGGSLIPGRKTYLPQTQAGVKVEPIYVPEREALRSVMEEIAVVTNRIEEAHFYRLFMMMEALGDQTGRTATEIAERKDEKAGVLGPTLESVTDEGLDPIIISTYMKADRAGRIPPPPDVLDKVPLKIEYTSILAQAMKAAGTMGIERLIMFVANAVKASGNPALFDKIDFDQSVDEYADRVGSPATLVRDDDAVADIRAARAGKERQAQMLQAAKPVADAANAIKTLGEAVPQDGSVGQGLAEQLSGAAA